MSWPGKQSRALEIHVLTCTLTWPLLFDKMTPHNNWGGVFRHTVLEKACEKTDSLHYLPSCAKLTCRWTVDLNKSKAITFLKDNMEHLHDTEVGKDLLCRI